MKKLLAAFAALVFLGLSSPADAQRVALQFDGNYSDKDDWGASAMALALLSVAGKQADTVNIGYANIIARNNSTWLNQITTSVTGGATRFLFDHQRIFRCRTTVPGCVNSLRDAINTSTAADPLYVIAAGPMEILWRALNAANASARQHVTVISHSNWNNTTIYGHSNPTYRMSHDWNDVKAFGVRWIQIKNQNPKLATKNANGSWNWSPWFWLRDSADPNLNWIYQRMRASNKADISDAGMVYYFLTGDEDCTPAKLQAALGGSA